MKELITTVFAVILMVQLSNGQSSADKAKLPYEPQQISQYIYECSIGSSADKEFIENESNNLSIPAKTNYKDDAAYKTALINWSTNNPAKVEEFLIKRRDYQQGNLK